MRHDEEDRRRVRITTLSGKVTTAGLRETVHAMSARYGGIGVDPYAAGLNLGDLMIESTAEDQLRGYRRLSEIVKLELLPDTEIAVGPAGEASPCESQLSARDVLNQLAQQMGQLPGRHDHQSDAEFADTVVGWLKQIGSEREKFRNESEQLRRRPEQAASE